MPKDLKCEAVTADGHRATVITANRLWRRTMGFMGKNYPKPVYGFYFPRTRALHTLFMRFPLDLFYLDASGKILKTMRFVRPWRFSCVGPKGTSGVLELPAGLTGFTSCEAGDIIQLIQVQQKT